jgi:hypothetical protein
MDDLAELRLLVAEPTQEPFSDQRLSLILVAAGSLPKAAAEVWTQKAASYADLTDVQEGSSSRALSQLYRQALTMAASFYRPRGTRSRRIERG